MPNWATNDVEVYGDEKTLKKILADAKEGTYKNYFDWNREKAEYESFTTHKNLFSFQSLVPMPDLPSGKTIKAGEKDEGFAHAMRGDLDYPYDNAYDWHLAHWGTKWDLDQESITINEIEKSGEEFRFTLGFSTAWSPACQFWATLSAKYGVRVVNHYYEEGMDFIGTFEVDNGEVLNDTCVEISKAMWKKAGAVFRKNGEMIWGEGEIDLSVNFPVVSRA
jgi:hypothetical protein